MIREMCSRILLLYSQNFIPSFVRWKTEEDFVFNTNSVALASLLVMSLKQTNSAEQHRYTTTCLLRISPMGEGSLSSTRRMAGGPFL